MGSSVHQTIFELGIEFTEPNKMLLMSLMEETQDEEKHYGDDRLVSMIKSLEAEIGDPLLGQGFEIGHVDGRDCSTSINDNLDHWVDMELVSSSPFDEMNAWIPSGNEMEHASIEYEDGNGIDDFQLYYGVFLEQQHREAYLSQGSSDDVVVF